MSRLNIAVAGASGRMGRMLVEAVLQSTDCALSGALDVAGSPALGQDAGAFAGKSTGVVITADLATGLKDAQVLIDFTRPEGTLAHLAACRARGVKMVIGTTGMNDAQKAQVADAAKDLAIVFAPNMDVGVNVVLQLLALAGKALAQGYDVEVIEAHHKHKIDAPSGTALAMGDAVARAQGKNLKDCAVYAREGHTGERKDGSIGFATIRGGDVVGDHTVMFIGQGERIEISHKSGSRAGYADGSLRAARFLASRAKGLFDMQDVLGMR
ncbi:dihydrodipicolinate reductase [Burkholderiales bacterium JOSHI_001]|nr:dihydrodipicolinate reductase [Burkholderiales bacterium JOSHI_001]